MKFWNELTKQEQAEIIDEVKDICWIRENAYWEYQCYFEDKDYNKRWKRLS